MKRHQNIVKVKRLIIQKYMLQFEIMKKYYFTTFTAAYQFHILVVDVFILMLEYYYGTLRH